MQALEDLMQESGRGWSVTFQMKTDVIEDRSGRRCREVLGIAFWEQMVPWDSLGLKKITHT